MMTHGLPLRILMINEILIGETPRPCPQMYKNVQSSRLYKKVEVLFTINVVYLNDISIITESIDKNLTMIHRYANRQPN